jgi:hypothetical protein
MRQRHSLGRLLAQKRGNPRVYLGRHVVSAQNGSRAIPLLPSGNPF